MEKSKVYYTDMSTSLNENLPEKLERLMKKAGIGDIDFKEIASGKINTVSGNITGNIANDITAKVVN